MTGTEIRDLLKHQNVLLASLAIKLAEQPPDDLDAEWALISLDRAVKHVQDAIKHLEG